jgi:hypothetical protein
MRALERARIAITNFAFENIESGGIRVLYDLRNSGRSVAYPMRLAQVVEFLETLPSPPIKPAFAPTAGVLQADEPLSLEIRITSITLEQAAAVKAGARLWIIGRMEYRDVFGDTHERGYAFGFDPGTHHAHPPPDPDPGYNYET